MKGVGPDYDCDKQGGHACVLDIPEDIPFLSHLIQREIVYRVLRTPQGARLRTIATAGDLRNRTARAITWLRDNYTKQVHMEELAAIARMGVTLHHQFRALTAMSPLQCRSSLGCRRQGSGCYGWGGCHKRCVRSRLRKYEPIQSRIQPLLRPTANARYQNSSCH